MARHPDYFFSVRFLSDRFHEGNHITCSWVHRSSAYIDRILWNTPAAEQINQKMEKNVKSVRYMNFRNAVQASSIFLAMNNVRAYDCALRAANI